MKICYILYESKPKITTLKTLGSFDLVMGKFWDLGLGVRNWVESTHKIVYKAVYKLTRQHVQVWNKKTSDKKREKVTSG